jgi:cell division protein FtsI (penicillin-binding protein 3)
VTARRRRNPVNRRIRLLLAFLLVGFAVLLGRAAWLQAVQAGSLSQLAAKQHREAVVVPASRGTIFDRTGVQLAIGEQATTVYADPRQVRDARVVANAAAKTLGVDADVLARQLANKNKSFIYVQRKADPAKAALLEKRKLAGLGFYPEERRFYPQGSVASHILGYAGVDNRGLAGLELQLDKTISGRPGSETRVIDALGHAIDVVDQRPAIDGRNVRLTIDHTIQANAEAVLRQTVSKWGAKGATAVVLDPRSGDVLAMANAPGFDANFFGSTAPAAARNRAVTDVYEPGSTFKLVTVAGVLSDGIVQPQTRFTLPYSIHVADRVVHDAEERGTETMSVARILAQSSNVGAITLAEKLGPTRLYHWMRRFGYGASTGVGFPGESPGFVLKPDEWSGSTIGNVPIGQGVAVTPIQMAAAYATIANRGLWVRPHLLEKVQGEKRVRPHAHRILRRGVAAELNAMLQNVVREGTGTLAAVPGYKVAGKTGTAQKPDSHGGYSGGRYVASFVGMVPASRPRLVVLVMVDEPHGAIWGGVVAAPAFAQIAAYDLQYLEVPPDALSRSTPSPS